MLNASTAKAAILGFLFCAPARDVVRGFGATFTTKSGKENGRLGRPTHLSATAWHLPVRRDAHAISTTPPDLPFRRGGVPITLPLTQEREWLWGGEEKRLKLIFSL